VSVRKAVEKLLSGAKKKGMKTRNERKITEMTAEYPKDSLLKINHPEI